MSLSSLAEYVKAHPEAFRFPYEPVTLPKLPRQKCPHVQITAKRVSDEMSTPIAAPCRGKVLSHGWCEEHAGSHQLLMIGATLGYPEMDLTISVIDHGKRQNIGRIILPGQENWEAYAEYVSSAHARQDIARLKIRFDM